MRYLFALCAFALLACTTNTETVYEEKVTIEYSTKRWLPVVVDSLWSDDISPNKGVACDTDSNLCVITVTHTKDDEMFNVDVQFFAQGKNVGSLSAYIDNWADGTVVEMSPLIIYDTVAAMIEKQQQCVTGSPNCISDPRNGGRNYRTVTIGTQTWMAENLNYPVADNFVTGAKSFCYGEDFESHGYSLLNCARRGRLYNWAALFDGTVAPGVQGICPSGWHVPTDHEWTILEMTAGLSAADTSIANDWRGSHASSLRLKSPLWGSGYTLMTDKNATGFSAIPGGVYDGYEHTGFLEMESDASFWTSTPYTETIVGSVLTRAYKRKIGTTSEGIRRDSHHQANAYSLRCLMN